MCDHIALQRTTVATYWQRTGRQGAQTLAPQRAYLSNTQQKWCTFYFRPRPIARLCATKMDLIYSMSGSAELTCIFCVVRIAPREVHLGSEEPLQVVIVTRSQNYQEPGALDIVVFRLVLLAMSHERGTGPCLCNRSLQCRLT